MLSRPEGAAERPREGLSGRLDGRLVRVGGNGFVQAGYPAEVPAGHAAADVGVALGGQAMGAGAYAADAVLLGEPLAALPKGLRIARRSIAIARQSAYAGIGLSSAAMVAAALGWLIPVEGALLQEAIDVAVVLNALRD